jgi:bifunctional enzyme CysN/CysC
MAHQSALIAEDIDSYLAQHEQKELLRFLTCGSVDDGKSTLIGRLLFDSKMLYEDQLAAIHKESSQASGGRVTFDPALVTDGLKAEREQGITIDVAYRYFSTAKRKFIIADTPGHEQYTRNMATGASTCDLAIILVDARHGIVTQTRRHTFIASLLGIKHLVVAVNKMDLVGYSEEAFDNIVRTFQDFAGKLEVGDISFIPLSALDGDNVVEPSENMPWYRGSTLMHLLENVHIASDRNLIDLRIPVQYVNRPDSSFRGYCATVASGTLRSGDEIMVLPSRRTSTVQRIVTADGDLDSAGAQQAITVTLDDEIDISRGDVLIHPNNQPRVARRADAMIVWMSEAPMRAGDRYLFKHLHSTTGGTVSEVRYRIDVNTLHRQEADGLALNEIGRCSLTVSRPFIFDSYRKNRQTGSFIVIDRITNATVGAGMFLDRTGADEGQAHWETEPSSDSLNDWSARVTTEERAERLQQRPATLFLTGLSGAGKSTTAGALERALFDAGHFPVVLDGEGLRRGISRDLDFSSEGRSEAVRRAAEIARMANDAGLISICAFVAPSAEVRAKAMEVIGSDRFLEIHLDAPVEVCRERDQSSFQRSGADSEGVDIPGVTSPYEAPASPALHLKTDQQSVDECVEEILSLLEARGFLT